MNNELKALKNKVLDLEKQQAELKDSSARMFIAMTKFAQTLIPIAEAIIRLEAAVPQASAEPQPEPEATAHADANKQPGLTLDQIRIEMEKVVQMTEPAAKILAPPDLSARQDALEKLFRIQQQTLELLGKSVCDHQRYWEEQMLSSQVGALPRKPIN